MREVLLAVGKSVGVNLAVLAIWYIVEYWQFKELQWDRRCDDKSSVCKPLADKVVRG